MAQYRLLPNVLPRIDTIIRSLGIQPVDKNDTPARAAAQQARFYMTPVHWRGQVVWFKASLQDAPGLTRGLTEEIRIQRAFADYERGRKVSFDSPSFLQAGRRGPVTWLLRRYWTGWFAGEMEASFGYSRRFVQTISPTRLSAVLADVRRMTLFMRRRLRLAKHDVGWYLLDFHFYRRHFFIPILSHRLNPGWTKKTVNDVERLLKQSSPWMRRQATWFTHGDFYPNNVMVTGLKHKQVILFDWELSHLNLMTFDSAMAWLMAWRYPAWQDQFRRSSLRQWPTGQNTERAWALATLSLGVRLAGFAWLRLTNGQPERYPPLPKKYRATMARLFKRMVRVIEESLGALDRLA